MERLDLTEPLKRLLHSHSGKTACETMLSC